MKPVRFSSGLLSRTIAALLIPLQLLAAWPAQLLAADLLAASATAEPPPQRAAAPATSAHGTAVAVPEAAPVTINTTVPAVAKVAPALAFSTPPTLAELTACRLLAEPLLPLGTLVPAAKERAALGQALLAFDSSPNHEDTSPLEEFLAAYPQSAFRVALLTDLGLLYRSHGLWSRALSAWQQAWAAGKAEADPTKRLLVDRALAQLAELTARLGRVSDLQALLAEVSGRDVRGPAAEKLAGARTSLFLMQSEPTKSFRCGPLAVGSVLRALSPRQPVSREVHESVSTDHGTSLVMVEAFARKLGLDYQPAFREAGAEVLVPSVVHWKVGHYGALTQEIVAARFLVKDPTFTDDFVVSPSALDQEASGYFLVRAGALPPGWRSVPPQEAQGVWGKGSVPPNTPPPPPCQCPGIACPTCDGGDGSGNGGNGGNSGGGSGGSGGGWGWGDGGGWADPTDYGMPAYDVDPSRVNLSLSDTPLFYHPPRGPKIRFKASYSARDVAPAALPNYPNLGAQWNFGWVGFILDDPNNATTGSYGPGGGNLSYVGYVSTGANTGAFAPQTLTQSVLARTSATSYLKTFKDGSKQVFGLADNSTPRRIFLTEYDDPAGNKLLYTYDPTHFRLLSVSDALGQVTTLSYVSNDAGSTNGDYYRVAQVTDPFGRSASFAYNPSGQLSQITDMAGLVSQFTYGSGNAITTLTTPYGNTTFAENDIGADRSLTITDPTGAAEKVEFKYTMTPPDSSAPVPSAPGLLTQAGYNAYRTSYYWDKKAYALAPTDYSQAHLYHFCHTSDGNSMSDILESEKPALESRVYYNYLGQTNAYVSSNSNLQTMAARVLDDGSTQLSAYDYNAQGKLTKAVSPGDANTPTRTTTYQYAANGIDRVATYQQNPAGYQQNPAGVSTDPYGVKADLLGSMVYDTQGKHLVTSTKDAAGQSTSFTYNAYGQPLSVTNAKAEKTTFTYDRNQAGVSGQTDGYLKTVTGPVTGATVSYAYDGFGRVKQVTDSEGYTVGTTYDATGGVAAKTLNRVAGHTYPDGTYEEVDYDRLEPQWTRDRLGRWTQLLHDELRRVTGVIDPLERLTQYEWCSCGALEAIIDPAGNRTVWMRDAQSRVTAKIYPDNTTVSTTYEASTSRVKSTLDAKGQRTNFLYNVDDTLQSLSYTDASGNALVPPTPGVSYTFDPVFPRLKSMVDGIGTTTYAYNPVPAAATLGAGRLASVAGPFANSTLAFTYDALGRVGSQSLNGAANAATLGYDTLGRVHTVNNTLGAFTYNFVRNTGRLDNVALPNGQTTQYSYFSGTSDPRLQTIKNATSAASLLSQFDYTYNAVGDILSWTQNNPGLAHPRQYAFGYDAKDELTSASLTDTVTSGVLRAQAFGYDAASNRTSVQDGNSIATETPNRLNQLTATSGGGQMRFAGTVSKPSRITVGGNPATVRADGTYEGSATVAGTGTTRVHIVATDSSGNVTDKYTDITPGAVAAQSFGYDLNGNQMAAGPSGAEVTYGWDAANRLISITKAGSVTQFDYDGMGRRVREKLNGTEIKHWVWAGLSVAEERDSGNNVTKRFFAQGEQIAGQKYFFTRDHLGSVRELTDSTQTVRARYDYDLYGLRGANQITTNPVEADFGFTGHYFHASSGLHLALYRAYDAKQGRWISRDPIAEKGGINLYGYASRNPINLIDPDGREAILAVVGAAIGGAVNAYENYGAYQSGQISGSQYAGSIAFGAGLGALAGLTNGVAGGVFVGGLTSGLNTAYNAGLKNQCIDASQIGKSAAIGALTGGLGALAGKLGGQLYSPFNPLSQIGQTVGRAGSGVVQTLGNAGAIIGNTVGTLAGEYWGG